MGRTGGGGSMGGGFSHSSHSSSLSHSSHTTSSRGSFGGSSRGSFGNMFGGSTNRQSRGSGPAMRSPGMRGPGPGIGGPAMGGGMRTGSAGRGCAGSGCGCSGLVGIVLLIILCLFVLLGSGMSCVGSSASGCGGSSDTVKSTINRTRLEGVSFTANCVVDELGWIRADGSSESAVGSELETFWKETGVQPYVVLLAYDSAFYNDDARYDYAEQYYQDNIKTNGALLLMYFDSGDDYTDGTWEMVKGPETTSIMDSEATEIFWNYLDRHWYSYESSGDAIVGMFNDTAAVIMKVSTTGWDVLKIVAIIVLVIAVIVGVIIILKMRRKQQAEKAAEDERILNTPLEHLSADNDPLAQKYADSGSNNSSNGSSDEGSGGV